jgi:hypothetical protein
LPEKRPLILSNEQVVVYSTIRMISDVPTFVGGDGQNYTVKAGDIAVIPLDQAMVLYNRGMAVLMVDEA